MFNGKAIFDRYDQSVLSTTFNYIGWNYSSLMEIVPVLSMEQLLEKDFNNWT